MRPVPALPDRDGAVVAGLPGPFARSQVDANEPALALTPDGLVVSTDAWSGRHLARLVDGRWTRVTSGRDWHLNPRWDGTLTHQVVTGPDEDPDAPDYRADGYGRTARLVRRGRERRVVVDDLVHEIDSLVEIGPWLGSDELLVVRERWPRRLPYSWHVGTNELRPLSTGLGVTSGFRALNGVVGFTRTTCGQPRQPELVRIGELVAGLPLGDDTTARAVLVPGARCALPALVHDPEDRPLGTIVLLHGGPNGSHLATWSPLADSLVLAGWRVVRPNVRGSGLLDSTQRPPRPDHYGTQDAQDVADVVRRLGVGPVVVGGSSYGGYLAARAAHEAPEVRGVFLLSGFLARADLAETAHTAVGAFLRMASFARDREPAPVPHFVAHGTDDPRIPAHSVLGRALPPGSSRTTFLGGHGVYTDDAARQVFPRLFDWLTDIRR